MRKKFLIFYFLLICVTVSSQTYRIESYEKINELHGGFNGNLDNQDFFGISIAYIGDLDDNGVDDLAVGAFGDDDGGSEKGAVWILFLDENNNVINETKISATTGDFNGQLDNNDVFGDGLAFLGDLNNDGLIEIAVGAAYDGDGGFWHGAVWILSLNSDGTVNKFSKISDTQGGFTGFINGDAVFGCDIENIGDLNNDGIDDLAVGSRRDSDGGSNRGAIWILFMNNDFTVNSFQKISDTQGGFAEILQFEDFFGGSVTNIGDLDGDGITDIIVGSYRDDDQITNSGSFYVLFLNSNGTVKSHQKVSSTFGGLNSVLSQNALFGRSIDGFLDIDGDGKIEIVVGALRQVNPTLSIPTGAFFIIEINNDGTVSEEYLYTYAENCFGGQLDSGDFFGGSVSVLSKSGNVSIATGAYRDSENGSQKGAVWILNLGVVNYTLASTNPTGCGINDGSITISALNTNIDYTITYNYEGASVSLVQSSNGSGIISLSGLSTGIYDSIVVTEDATGCTDNLGEIELSAPPLMATIISTNPTVCGIDDGAIMISGLNSNVDYTVTYNYEGTPVSTVDTSDVGGIISFTGLPTGIYDTIVVTENATMCTDNLGEIELSAPPLMATIISTNPTVCGIDDGAIMISGLNSNVDYTVTYNYEGTPVSTVDTSDVGGIISFTGLPTGIYDTIVVTENTTMCTDNLGQVELICNNISSICFKTKKYFTPNGDGQNDFWEIEQTRKCDYILLIFNRYGKLLKTLTPSNNKWDGNFNGNKLPSDDYWFTVSYTDDATKNNFRTTSHFTLKR